MNTVENAIMSNLSLEHQDILRKVVNDNAHDKIWCRSHGINYVNPDFSKIREITYKEQFENKTPEEIDQTFYMYDGPQYTSFMDALKSFFTRKV